jgi:transcriptional regulator with XRE-family HTH domain
MENPIKLQRMSLGLSQRELAEKAGVSRTLITGTEAGLYANPSPKILTALNMNSTESYRAYDAFQVHHRRTSGKHFLEYGPLMWEFKESRVTGGVAYYQRHTLDLLLDGRSVDSFKKALCVPNAPVYQWHKKPKRVLTIPESVQQAMHDAGMEEDFVEACVGHYERFRKNYA